MDTITREICYNQQSMFSSLPELRFKQLKYEIETWKRMIDFMMDENIYLKNRISEILKDKFDDKLLAKVEDFQNIFLKEDQLIGFLRNEVAALEDVLDFAAAKKEMENKIAKSFFKLRCDMSTTEQEFWKLKLQFNGYFLQNL